MIFQPFFTWQFLSPFEERDKQNFVQLRKACDDYKALFESKALHESVKHFFYYKFFHAGLSSQRARRVAGERRPSRGRVAPATLAGVRLPAWPSLKRHHSWPNNRAAELPYSTRTPFPSWLHEWIIHLFRAVRLQKRCGCTTALHVKHFFSRTRFLVICM
jgi:hypothetical protein